MSKERLRAIGAGWTACGRRLEQSGIDLRRYTYEPMDFEVGFSLGLIAKVLVAVVAATVLVGAVAVVWAVRRIKARGRFRVQSAIPA